MPEISLWALVIAFAVIAFASTLKIAGFRRTIKHLEEELSAARSEERALKIPDDNDIQDIKSINDHGRDKAVFTSDEPIHFNNLLWLENDPAPFCPRCYEVDRKKVHMQLRQYLNRPNRFWCPGCYLRTNYSVHPLLKD